MVIGMFQREKHKEKKRSGYIFTARKHPEKGIMSTILGAISVVSLGVAVYLTYQNGGNAAPQYGAVAVLVMVFALAGLILGVLSRMEKDNYYLFPYLGIGLNFFSLMMLSLILNAGI